MSSTLSPLVPVTLVLAAVGFGCSANVGPETDAGTSQRLALLEVRVHQGIDGSVGRLDAAARFVSVREPGVPNDALELLGLAWGAVPAGTCLPVADSAIPAATAFRVDLKDLSPVGLELRGDDGQPFRLRLEPRAFPDVAGLVSGVVFVAPADTTALATPKSASLDVGGIAIGNLELPELPSRVQLVGATPEGGTWTVGSVLELATGVPSSGDRIAIDVVRGGVVRAHCGIDTQGKTRIDLGTAGEATLVVRAQRRLLRDDATLGVVEARLERDTELKLLVK